MASTALWLSFVVLNWVNDTRENKYTVKILRKKKHTRGGVNYSVYLDEVEKKSVSISHWGLNTMPTHIRTLRYINFTRGGRTAQLQNNQYFH